MHRRLYILMALSLTPLMTYALIPAGLKINSQLKPVTTDLESEHGFQQTFEHDGIEVHIKGTKFSSVPAAKQMAAVEYANIVRLYSTRGNPYQGQISDLVKCSAQYNPRLFQFQLAGVTVPAVAAGATERKLFGACARETVGYWAAYFSFYYPPAQMVIEARLFKKAAHPPVESLGRLTQELQAAARHVLAEAK